MRPSRVTRPLVGLLLLSTIALVLLVTTHGASSAEESANVGGSPPEQSSRCRHRPAAVQRSRVPKDVRRWAHGDQVVGGPSVWALRAAIGPTLLNPRDGSYTLKFPWYLRPPRGDVPKITGRRVDGEGVFRFAANPAVSDGTWVSSGLDFSTAGCWKVTALYRRSELTVWIPVVERLARCPEGLSRIRRCAELRDVRLGAGESIAIGIHPSAEPSVVRASAPGLEACQASLDGGVIDESGGSWPGTAVDTCLSLDEPSGVELWSPESNSFHVAFAVRAVDGAPVRIDALSLRYQSVDGFFEVSPAPIASGHGGPRLIVTPFKSRTIGVTRVSAVPRQRHELAIDLTQNGRRVRGPRTFGRDPERKAFGPVRLRQPVTIDLRNDGPNRDEAVELLIDWS